MEAKLNSIIPKLPMKNLASTRQFYVERLHFNVLSEYGDDYLIITKDDVEIHFFHFPQLVEADNYAMCYIRVKHIEELYTDYSVNQVVFAQLGKLEEKPWGQKEFSVVDVNCNLLTFGEAVGINTI